MLRLRHPASATAYERNMQQPVQQRMPLSQAGYTTSSMLSPYSRNAAPVAPIAAQGPGAVATFPEEVRVGYQSRTGAQDSTEGRQTARGEIGLLDAFQRT